MHWSGARPSQLNLVLETKPDFYLFLFFFLCNGQNREGKKKEGWLICWGLLHFTRARKISVSRDTEAFISRWELGGRSRCLSLWQALRKPLSTSAWKAQQAFLQSTNCCQLSKWNGSAVSLPGCVLAKIQSDYKPIAPACPRSRKPPSAGWWDLVSVTGSAAPCLLQYVCNCSLGAVALLAGLTALPPSPSCGNDDFLKKLKKKKKGGEEDWKVNCCKQLFSKQWFLGKTSSGTPGATSSQSTTTHV